MLNREASLPVSVLRELLTLVPETGRLFWKPRSAKFFKGTARRTPEHAAANWSSRYAGTEALTAKQSSGHLHGRIFDQRFYAHRVVFAMTRGHWPNESIDHINGDPTDNRPGNLRDVCHRVNHMNQNPRKNNTSGCMGVTFNKRLQKWQASITLNYRSVHLGFFEHKVEAIQARKLAQKNAGFHENHGEKAA